MLGGDGRDAQIASGLPCGTLLDPRLPFIRLPKDLVDDEDDHEIV
jgi:hypothetical protein